MSGFLWQLNNKKWLQVLLILLCLSPVYLLTQATQHYEQTIGQVIATKQVKTDHTTDEHGNRDQVFSQTVILKIQNGPYEGQNVTTQNNYTASQINNQAYQKGAQLFLSLKAKGQQVESATIEGVKRDGELILIALLFVSCLVVVGGKSGLFSLLSLGVNGFLLSVLIDLFIDSNSTNLVLFFSLSIPFFVISSLVLVSGSNRKTYAAILATLAGTFLSFAIGWLVISVLNHKGLRYEEMNFVTRAPHDIFLASLLIGCLGAVMDIAITISSSLFELVAKNAKISTAELLASGKEIGKDIMGPMTNVLLFSYISGSLPLLVIFLRNQMSFQYTFSFILSLEFARALVGSIGIVLAIPLSIYGSVWVLRYRRKPK